MHLVRQVFVASDCYELIKLHHTTQTRVKQPGCSITRLFLRLYGWLTDLFSNDWAASLVYQYFVKRKNRIHIAQARLKLIVDCKVDRQPQFL